jgi:hypothetical protein
MTIETTDRRFPDRQAGSNHEPFQARIVRYGEPVDLSAAVLFFTIKNRDDGTKPIDSQEASGDADGVFTYSPTIDEVSTPGNYQCQIRINYPDDSIHLTLLLELRILTNL